MREESEKKKKIHVGDLVNWDTRLSLVWFRVNLTQMTRDDVVRKDIKLLNLIEHIALYRKEWRKRIHIAEPN